MDKFLSSGERVKEFLVSVSPVDSEGRGLMGITLRQYEVFAADIFEADKIAKKLLSEKETYRLSEE